MSAAPYSVDSDLLIYGEDRLNNVLQDESQRAERILDARLQADASINAQINACYAVPLHIELTGTWTVAAGQKGVAGDGTVATEDLGVGQMVALGKESHVVATITSDSAFTIREDHVAGATDVTALVLPSLIDSMVRNWSSVFTLERLLPGATAGSGSLKDVIVAAKKELADVCLGLIPLGDLVRTDASIGVAFEPLSDHLPDPRGDLLAQFGRGRLPLELT